MKYILLLMIVSSSVYGVDNSQLLSSQCYQCHGPNGHSLGEIDSIYGRPANDLYNDLMDMKSKEVNDIMHLQIKLYTESEIRKIANHLSTLN